MSFDDVAIVSVQGSDYRIYYWYMSKDDTVNLMKNSTLNEKSRYHKFFPLYIKMSDKTTYYKRNTDVVLNRAKEYYKTIKKD